MFGKSSVETMDHLFVYFPFSYILWCLLVKELGIERVISKSCRGMGVSLPGSSSTYRRNLRGKVVTIALWLERNQIIFEVFEEESLAVWD